MNDNNKAANLKTRLNSKWTIWFDDFNASGKPSAKEYEKNLYLISSFDCIENFWRTYNNIPTLKEIPISASYHLMKFGVKPLWEDKRNYPGSITKIKLEGNLEAEFLKECFIFMISLEFCNEYNEEEINGITIRKKEENDFLFEIWSNKKFEPKNFIDSFSKHVQIYVNFKFGKVLSKNCSDLAKAYKKKPNIKTS